MSEINSRIRKLLNTGFHWGQANEISKSPYAIVKNKFSYIVPALVTGSAATFAQSGTTVTVTSAGHNIPATVHDGAKVYVSSATSTGIAIPAGWYENFARTGTGTFTFTVPDGLSQTATGTITSNISETTVDDLTYLLRGGYLGNNGKLRFTGGISCNNSAGAKTLKIKLDTAVIGTVAITTAVFGDLAQDVVTNRGAQTRQMIKSTGAALTVDTTANKNVTVTLQCAAASDYVALETIIVEKLV